MNIQAPPNLSPGVYRELIDGRHRTTGAASRRSRPITSTQKRRGLRSPTCPQKRTARWQAAGAPPAGLSAYARAADTWLAPDDRHSRAAHERRRRLRARRRLGAGPDHSATGAAGARPRRRRRNRRAIVERATLGRTAWLEATIVRLFGRAMPTIGAVTQRRRRAATRGQRRRRALCRQPQHQLHQHLLLSLQVLRLLEGQDARGSARHAVRSRHRGNRPPRRSRHGIAAPRKCACKAASIPTTPARPIETSARRSRPACPRCTSTPSRRWK